MKKHLLTILSYGFIAYTIIVLGLQAIPQEYKEMLPKVNEFALLFSGSITGVTGALGLFLRYLTTRTEKELTQDRIAILELGKKLLDNTTKQESIISTIKQENDRLRKDNDDMKVLISNQNVKYDRLINLIETDLRVKQNNIFVDEKTKEMIGGALKNEKETD